MDGQRNIIPSHEILRIANQDAEPRYGDLTSLRVEISLHPDGWHVKFGPVEMINGGGPHYLIDPTSGTILSKKYYQ